MTDMEDRNNNAEIETKSGSLVDNEVKKLIKQTGYGEKIYIGMGAGSISNWMRNL